MALDRNTAPSNNFSLTHWKLGLPVNASGGLSGRSSEIKNLIGYQNAKYFYTASDGAMTFVAPVNGATTSGSRYARSELREMKGSQKAAWGLSTGGTLSATLEIDHAPIKFNGKAGRIVVGQIHGQDEELVRLYWENGKLYFVNDHAGSRNGETKFFFANGTGAQPNVSLNERFSYTIKAHGSKLDVTIKADGQTYTSVTTINSIWQSDRFYFKAGTYLGVNETQGTGYGQTSFYALSVSHGGSAGSSSSKSTHAIHGDSSNNTIHGKASADLIYGGYGNDVLEGGRGKDAFVFDAKLGSSKTDRKVNFDTIKDFSVQDDSIWLDNRIFVKLGQKGSVSSPALLNKDFFGVGSGAKDRNDYIIYNKTTGVLSYDADGSGKHPAIEFALLGKGLTLTHKDFFVI